MTLTLKGKTAFITGSTRGIGWAVARTFAAQGATILLNGVSSQEKLNERVEQLKSEFGIDSEGFLFDVSDAAAVKACYSKIAQRHQGLDILVNNAGILVDGLLGMITPEALERVFKVNVFGTMYNMQYAARLMIRRGGGSIINLSSIIGTNGNEGQVAYAGSKAAVIGMTLSAAKELAPSNIRVNAVAPGFIDTDMISALSQEKISERLAGIKMKRAGSAQEVADAILFLASDLSKYVTGQTLGVNGSMLV